MIKKKHMKLFFVPKSLIQEKELDLDQTKERNDMLFGFFQQLILKAINQKQTNLQSNSSKDETKMNT